MLRRMFDEADSVSALIANIYDAVLDEELWPQVLKLTCAYVRGCSAGLVAHDSVLHDNQVFYQWGVQPEFLKMYFEKYARLNPLHVPTLLEAQVGAVLASGDLLSHEQIKATRFFKGWLEPQGIVDAMSVFLEKTPTRYAIMGVHRHVRDGFADDAARQRMRILSPHFTRAMSISRLIERKRAEAEALAETLDGLAAAAMLVDEDARIVHMNAAAQALLSEQSIARMRSGALAFSDPGSQKAVFDVLRRAAMGDGAVGERGMAIPLARDEGQRWVAHVLALTSGARRRAGERYDAIAAVFITRAALDGPLPLQALAHHYALTPAEVRVLMALVQLSRVAEAADMLGISEATIRTHLRHLYEKTGTSRQADLVKVVSAFLSPIRMS